MMRRSSERKGVDVKPKPLPRLRIVSTVSKGREIAAAGGRALYMFRRPPWSVRNAQDDPSEADMVNVAYLFDASRRPAGAGLRRLRKTGPNRHVYEVSGATLAKLITPMMLRAKVK